MYAVDKTFLDTRLCNIRAQQFGILFWPANTWTFIYFRFYIYTKDLNAIFGMLYFAFVCSLMAQRKDVIIPGGPYGIGSISLNRGPQT